MTYEELVEWINAAPDVAEMNKRKTLAHPVLYGLRGRRKSDACNKERR